MRKKKEKKHREKQVGKNHFGKKHPILSGVEICHKHIPDSILTSSQAISILVNTAVYSGTRDCAIPGRHNTLLRET